MNFVNEFKEFINGTGLIYRQDGNSFYFPDKDTTIRLVLKRNDMFSFPSDSLTGAVIYLYEDSWYRDNEVVKKRICSNLGQFISIFARKCEIKKITTPQASDFLDKYHAYGAARSKYRYGLYFRDRLVAVSSFSDSRPMRRIIHGVEMSVNSYEWVRYASLPDCRIAGGMGKSLQAFVDDVHPDEVMTYADKEWSEGAAYTKLGFIKVEERAPVLFYVNTLTNERISLKKIASDKAYKDLIINEQYSLIQNMGSVKYLKSYL